MKPQTLRPSVLKETAKRLIKDPSGASAVKYLSRMEKDPERLDKYFKEAEKLAYPAPSSYQH